jgi:uncharacterized membrane protein
MVFFYTLLLVFTPWFCQKLEEKWAPAKVTGIVVNCFLIGSLFGHLLGNKENAVLVEDLSQASVLLGLPLLLFQSDLMGWLKLAKTTIVGFAIHTFWTVVICFLVGKIFQSHHPDMWKVLGMLVGVYVGGTANLLAIGKALELQSETMLMVNAAELMTGGIFFFILMSFGIRIAGKFLLPFSVPADEEEKHLEEINQHFVKLHWLQKAKAFVPGIFLSVVVVLLSVGVSFLLWKQISVITVIMSLSLFSIVFSLKKKIRELPGTTVAGNYLLNVFCVCIGSMARIDQIQSETMLFFTVCFVILIPLYFLDILTCRWLKVDRDTSLVTMTAGIYGPAFIPAMCEGLKNPRMIVSGVSTGLVGLATGNFLGLLVSYLLKP